jgi:hypothetical protein
MTRNGMHVTVGIRKELELPDLPWHSPQTTVASQDLVAAILSLSRVVAPLVFLYRPPSPEDCVARVVPDIVNGQKEKETQAVSLPGGLASVAVIGSGVWNEF